MNKLVSVIVPVYNTSCYLERCLNSIIHQTYSNLEIIIVNDGSTDNSLEICRSYEIKDNRVHVYSKRNGGVSSARNFGIEKSAGEYLMFVDSDDYIELDMIETLSEIMVDDVKMTMCSFKISLNNDNNIRELIEEKKFQIYNSRDSYLKVLQDNWAPWCKLINKELIADIRYDENVAIAEDLLFNTRLVCENEPYKIAYTNISLYNYVLPTESAMRQKYNSKFLIGLKTEEKVYQMFIEMGIEKGVDKILSNGVYVFYSRFSKLSKDEKKIYSEDYNESRYIIRNHKRILLRRKGKKFTDYIKMILIVFLPGVYFKLNN